MGFITKIFSAIVIIVILYLIGVFLFPDFTDNIGKQIGVINMNQKIRSLKTGADNVSENLLQIKSTSEIIDKTKNAVNTINDNINTTKIVINEKIDQTNKVVDSVKKTTEAVNELQKNISDLSSLTGSSSEVAGTINSSGSK